MSTESKTLFKERSDTYQNSQDRTKKAGVTTGLGILGLSVIALIVSLGIDYAIRAATGYVLCILPIIEIASAVGIPIGLIWTIVNLIRPTKPVTCPVCGTEHRVYKSVRKYMCPNCRALLLLGKDAKLMPQVSTCPYCGAQTAITADHGHFLCPNCGVVREQDGFEGTVGSQNCPQCQQSVPDGVIYCKSCGTVLKSDFSQPVLPALVYDQDWKIGKDGIGHFYFVQALLAGIRQKAGARGDIAAAQTLITDMENALISMEEALQTPDLQPHIEAILSQVDLTYAALLQFELDGIQALDLKKKLAKDALKTIAAEPHIAARRRIEGLLAASLESRGSIGKWDEKLVDVEQADKYSRVKGYQKLQQEIARFETWREQQRPPSIEPIQAEQPICPQCGREVRVGASFCGTCGAALG